MKPLPLACCALTALGQVQTAWIRDGNWDVNQADWGYCAANLSTQSGALGDPLAAGSRRYVQVYDRDANATACPAPQGSTFNIFRGLLLDWMP
jgi:hypothetical protein